jgi:Uma2 family endonuclease
MSALLTAPTPKLLTAAEFAERHGNDHVELVDGVVVELPMPGFNHGKLCVIIGYILADWVMRQDIGTLASHDSFIQTGTDPDRVRGPDFCYYSFERLPRGTPTPSVMALPPDFVVEVRSPSDRWNAVMAKAAEYLAAGVRVAIVVDGDSESVHVYRDAQPPQVLHRADTLTLPDVLPGFSVPVAKLLG